MIINFYFKKYFIYYIIAPAKFIWLIDSVEELFEREACKQNWYPICNGSCSVKQLVAMPSIIKNYICVKTTSVSSISQLKYYNPTWWRHFLHLSCFIIIYVVYADALLGFRHCSVLQRYQRRVTQLSKYLIIYIRLRFLMHSNAMS